MAHEMALTIVNDLQTQLAGLARGTVDMLKDGKVSPWEGMALGMKAMALGSYVLSLLQGMDPATQADILYVLEHGQWALPQVLGPEA